MALVFALVAAAGVAAKGTLSGLFGPPPVTLKEAYEARPDGPTMDHSALDALLSQYVDDGGLVDYDGLAGQADALNGYLDTLAQAPFSELGRDEKLALLINAYNAFTLRLMLDHPEVGSIQDIPAEEQWDAVRWNVAGVEYSLKQIENEQIRPNFIEPRIHWAVVCAAVGCPPLRNEAYTGAKLEQQLDEQTRRVLTRGTRWYQVPPVETPEGQSDGAADGAADGDTLWVTPIFEWYEGDFDQTEGGVAQYVAKYDDAVKNRIVHEDIPKVSSLNYDWQLNSQDNAELAANAAEAAMPRPDDEQAAPAGETADETDGETADETSGETSGE